MVGVDRRSRRPCAFAWGSTFARPRCGARSCPEARIALRGQGPNGPLALSELLLVVPGRLAPLHLALPLLLLLLLARLPRRRLRRSASLAAVLLPARRRASRRPLAPLVLGRANACSHTNTAYTSRLAQPRRPAAARAACAGAVVRHEVEVGEALAGRRPACRSTAVSHAQRS